jgi:hypothetical protein
VGDHGGVEVEATSFGMGAEVFDALLEGGGNAEVELFAAINNGLERNFHNVSFALKQIAAVTITSRCQDHD